MQLNQLSSAVENAYGAADPEVIAKLKDCGQWEAQAIEGNWQGTAKVFVSVQFGALLHCYLRWSTTS
jgi:hypothetical protein